MNMPRVIHILVLALGVSIPVHPVAGQTIPETWAALQRDCMEASAESKLVKDIISRCREKGIGIGDAHAMLASAVEAAGAGLPCRPVLAKIAEGLAKGVPPTTIAEVAQQRVRYLQNARVMLQSVHEKLVAEATIAAAAQAMESGLDADATRTIAEVGRDARPDELAALLEAAESLQLAGFDSDEIPPIVADCLNRRLNRVELKRAIRYSSQQKQRGMETGRIREALWGGEQGPAQQNRNREQNGQGSGAGSGPGGPHHGHGRP